MLTNSYVIITMTQPTNKQVSLTCAYVCNTKYDSAMFRIIESKYMDNEYLQQKVKEYEENQYIYINMKKLNNVDLDTSTKYKIYILFEDFTDKKGQYVLYYKQVLVKNKGLLPNRQFNEDIADSSEEESC